MTLSPTQTQIARRFLSSSIERNKVKSAATVRQYISRDKMPESVRYEADQLDAETETLQVILANLPLLGEGSGGRR